MTGIAEILTGLIKWGWRRYNRLDSCTRDGSRRDFLNLAIGVWEFRAVFAIPALRR